MGHFLKRILYVRFLSKVFQLFEPSRSFGSFYSWCLSSWRAFRQVKSWSYPMLSKHLVTACLWGPNRCVWSLLPERVLSSSLDPTFSESRGSSTRDWLHKNPQSSKETLKSSKHALKKEKEAVNVKSQRKQLKHLIHYAQKAEDEDRTAPHAHENVTNWGAKHLIQFSPCGVIIQCCFPLDLFYMHLVEKPQGAGSRAD